MSNLNDNKIIKDSNAVTPDKNPVKTSSSEDNNENVNEVSSSVEVPTSNTSPDVSNYIETKLDFTRSNILKHGNIHLVDSDDDNKIDMFCYVKCSEKDTDFIKKCRGVVFHEDELIMKAFPYTSEFKHTEEDNIREKIDNFNDWTFYEAHEGTLLRMFHFNGKWYVSTHRKLNAFRSKWASSESFGVSFISALNSEEEVNEKFRNSLPPGDNILERFQSTLDLKKQYMFLVRNNKNNRIVCDPPERPTVYHVGTFVDGNLIMTENINIPHPKKLDICDIDKLISHVRTLSYRLVQGVIGFTPDNRQIKIVHEDYQDLFRARGNEPSIKFRYLQIRMNKRFVNMLYYLYPDMVNIFEEYENTLFDIARCIYRAYVQRFIKKRYVTVPREEFAIIRECHSWHLLNRSENLISLNQVINVLNQQSATHLNHMMRRFKLERSRQKEHQSFARPRSESIRSSKSFEQSPETRKTKNNQNKLSPLILSQGEGSTNQNLRNI